MGAVIEFPAERVAARAQASRSLTGEVLIFTGVRVERRDSPPPELAKKTRSAVIKANAEQS